MAGFKDMVTDHRTGDVLRYMDYQSDQINYQNRLQEISRKGK